MGVHLEFIAKSGVTGFQLGECENYKLYMNAAWLQLIAVRSQLQDACLAEANEARRTAIRGIHSNTLPTVFKGLNGAHGLVSQNVKSSLDMNLKFLPRLHVACVVYGKLVIFVFIFVLLTLR